jgi:UDP-glucuronate decarboxylase
MPVPPILPEDLAYIFDQLGNVDWNALAGKSVILTGAAGFLGRYVVRVLDDLNARYLLGRPCTVIAMDSRDDLGDVYARWAYRQQLQKPEFVEFVHHDLTRGIGFTTKFDYVIHMAGIASPYWYARNPLMTIDVAIQGSRHMLEIAKRDGARYLFTSSSEVYQTPPPDSIPTPETYIGAIPTMGPRSCYDVSKAMGETLAHVYAKQFGVHATLVRIHNTYGPGLGEGDHRILPRLASAIKGGRKLQVFRSLGIPFPTRTYCYVADLVAGLFQALLRGQSDRVYNLGNSSPEITVPQLALAASDLLGYKVPIEVVESPAVYVSEPMRRCPDISRARAELGYKPSIGLDVGLRRFFDWALESYTGAEPPK